MQIPETLKNYKSELLVIIVFLILQNVIRHIASGLSSEVVQLLSLLSIILLLTIYINIISIVYMPIAAVKFVSRYDPIPFIIDENNPVKPSINFFVSIQTNGKFGTLLRMSKILKVEHSKIYFQLYWKNCELLQVEANDDYTLLEINGYPCISLKETNSNSPYKYSFKMSSSPKHPESFTTKIETKLYFEDATKYRCKILKYFMKVESESREVFIKRNIKSKS